MTTLRYTLAALTATTLAASASAVGVSNLANVYSDILPLTHGSYNLFQQFTVGDNPTGTGFRVTSMSLDVFAQEASEVSPFANPSNQVNYSAIILEDSGGSVGGMLGAFDPLQDTTLAGAETISFTVSDALDLQENTSYWLAFLIEPGQFAGVLASSDTSETGDSGWSIADTANYIPYTSFPADPVKFALEATPIPEPATYGAIGGLAALGVVALRRRRS